MLSVFRKKSDREFIEAVRSAPRRRLIGAGLLFLLGLHALFFLAWESVGMYHKYFEFAKTLSTMNIPADEQGQVLAQNVYFFHGVRVGHTTNLALVTCVMSICLAIGLCRTSRKDRMLVEYYDRTRTLES